MQRMLSLKKSKLIKLESRGRSHRKGGASGIEGARGALAAGASQHQFAGSEKASRGVAVHGRWLTVRLHGLGD